MTTVLSQATAPTRRKIWIDLLLYPGHTLPTAAAPVLVAIGLAVRDGVFAAKPVLFAFLASWLVHVGGVFTDNLVLVTKHADIPEHPELLAALRGGGLSVRGLTVATLAWFAAAAAFAPYLADLVGWNVVVLLGIVGIISAAAYAGGPLPYTRLGLSDPVFFAMFALVAAPAAYLVQAAAHTSLAHASAGVLWRLVPADAFIVGLPIGALVTNVLLIDEIRDVDFDRAKGWRTGAVRGGRGFARAELAVLTVFAYVIPILLWAARGYGFPVMLPLFTLPMAIGIASRVASSDRFEDLFPLTPAASRLALFYSLLLATGLAIA